MPLLTRIPALLVALGLLTSGGQATVCDFVDLVGIDLHAPAEHCDHSDADHTHSSSEQEPCNEECLVELSEGIAPVQESLPSLLVAANFAALFLAHSVSLSERGFYPQVSVVWHGPPLEQPPSQHCDPLFSGCFLV